MTEIFGLLNINKPSGPTSHDIVVGVRRGTRMKRVGHAGTLDPIAQGVLILALGKATRLSEYLMQLPKGYEAQILLGTITDTYDTEGEVVTKQDVPSDLSLSMIETALMSFRGEILQKPPIYSAIKVQGKAAYARARAGEAVELKPRTITIYELNLVAFAPPRLTLQILCSSGTYIRALAHDFGQKLGCGAVLEKLIRTASGNFRLAEATPWERLLDTFEDGTWQESLIPADRALPGTPKVPLTAEQYERLRNGAPFSAPDITPGLGRAYSPDGHFVAVLRGEPERGVWQPHKVLVGV
jgi:tRNA pseudouridine55 synthase